MSRIINFSELTEIEIILWWSCKWSITWNNAVTTAVHVLSMYHIESDISWVCSNTVLWSYNWYQHQLKIQQNPSNIHFHKAIPGYLKSNLQTCQDKSNLLLLNNVFFSVAFLPFWFQRTIGEVNQTQPIFARKFVCQIEFIEFCHGNHWFLATKSDTGITFSSYQALWYNVLCKRWSRVEASYGYNEYADNIYVPFHLWPTLLKERKVKCRVILQVIGPKS